MRGDQFFEVFFSPLYPVCWILEYGYFSITFLYSMSIFSFHFQIILCFGTKMMNKKTTNTTECFNGSCLPLSIFPHQSGLHIKTILLIVDQKLRITLLYAAFVRLSKRWFHSNAILSHQKNHKHLLHNLPKEDSYIDWTPKHFIL